MKQTELTLWIKRQIRWRYDQWKYKSQHQSFSVDKNAIFCLHGFNKSFGGFNYGQSSKNMLRGCLRTLSYHYRFLSLSEIMSQNDHYESVKQAKPAAAFTIDDGFQSILSVLDVFKEFHLMPTIFVCPELIDEGTIPFPDIVRLAFLLTNKNVVPLPASAETNKIESFKDRIRIILFYIEHLKLISPRDLSAAILDLLKYLNLDMADIQKSKYYDPLLRWDKIKEILPSVKIGSHTCRHLNLSSLSDEESHYEISASKKMIEKQLSLVCEDIAYPFGNRECFTTREEQYIKESGYKNAYSLEPGYLTNHDSPFHIHRFNIGDGLRIFAAYCQAKIMH